MCGVTSLLSAAPGIEARDAPNWVTLDAKGNVRSFYGVPVSLTRSGLKRLGFKTSREYGDYKLMARDKVEIYVTFDRRGNFYRATTMSKNAVGPRGIRVGSRRSEVTAAFPKGRFGYGCEDGFNAVSTTGTNVLFDYDTKDMPPRALQCEQLPDSEVPDLKVKAIRIESMAIG
jgi:hypothetical protein